MTKIIMNIVNYFTKFNYFYKTNNKNIKKQPEINLEI